MNYSNLDLVQDLESNLANGYNAIEVAKAAYLIYLDRGRELSKEMDQVLLTLMMMEEGKEFELGEVEFMQLLDALRHG